VAALDVLIAGQDTASFTYPTVLYKVVLLDGSFRWVFREELPILRGRYSRRDRIHIGSDQQSLTIERTDKTIADMSLARFIADRPSGYILKWIRKPRTKTRRNATRRPRSARRPNRSSRRNPWAAS
jgi:hypothetical protein